MPDIKTMINIEVGYQGTMTAGSWTTEATGHTYRTLPVEVAEVLPIEDIAEAVFEADNAPFLAVGSLPDRIREADRAVTRATGERHHSLSVGDRVRVGEVEVVCAEAGFQRVRKVRCARCGLEDHTVENCPREA